MPRQKTLIKLTASFMAALYFSGQVALTHATEINFWKERKNAQPLLAQLPILPPLPGSSTMPSANKGSTQMPLIQILPAAYGSVRKITGPQKEAQATLIHIQDVHQNDEAQLNISRTVQELIDKKQIDFVALEGASGVIDLGPFRKFPQRDAVKIAADYLLRQKEISGPIYSALTSVSPIPVFVGVDESIHYQKNIEAYRVAHPQREKVKAALALMEQAIAKKKEEIFAGRLRAFDNTVTAYQNGQMDLGPYVETLSQFSNSIPLGVEIFLETWIAEKNLNLSQVEKDRAAVINKLVSSMTPPEANNLLNAGVDYRMGRMTHTDFYQTVKTLCEEKNISLSRYKAFDQCIQYILLSNQIDSEKLFRDLKVTQHVIYSELATSPEQKVLVDASRWLNLASKLVDFSLTKEEWGEYKAVIAKERILRLRQFHEINEIATASPIPLGLAMTPFESFYEEALIRDEKMAEATLRTLNNSKNKVGVLVTGGFHSAGIEKNMKEKGVTIVSFVPKLSHVDEESGSTYLSVFDQEKTPLDQLFEGEKLFLAKNPGPNPNKAAVLIDATEQNLRPGSLFSVIPNFLGRVVRRTQDSLTVALKNGAVNIVFGSDHAIKETRFKSTSSSSAMSSAMKSGKRTRERIEKRFGNLAEWKVRLLAPFYELGQVFLPWFLFLHANRSMKDYGSRLLAQAGILFTLFYWSWPVFQLPFHGTSELQLFLFIFVDLCGILALAFLLQESYELLTIIFPRILSPLTTSSAPINPDDELVDVAVLSPTGETYSLKVFPRVKSEIEKYEEKPTDEDRANYLKLKKVSGNDELFEKSLDFNLGLRQGLHFIEEGALIGADYDLILRFLLQMNQPELYSVDSGDLSPGELHQFLIYLCFKNLLIRSIFSRRSDPIARLHILVLDHLMGDYLWVIEDEYNEGRGENPQRVIDDSLLTIIRQSKKGSKIRFEYSHLSQNWNTIKNNGGILSLFEQTLVSPSTAKNEFSQGPKEIYELRGFIKKSVEKIGPDKDAWDDPIKFWTEKSIPVKKILLIGGPVDTRGGTAKIPNSWQFRLDFIESLSKQGYQRVAFHNADEYVGAISIALDSERGTENSRVKLTRLLNEYLARREKSGDELIVYLGLNQASNLSPEFYAEIQFWERVKALLVSTETEAIVLLPNNRKDAPTSNDPLNEQYAQWLQDEKKLLVITSTYDAVFPEALGPSFVKLKHRPSVPEWASANTFNQTIILAISQMLRESKRDADSVSVIMKDNTSLVELRNTLFPKEFFVPFDHDGLILTNEGPGDDNSNISPSVPTEFGTNTPPLVSSGGGKSRPSLPASILYTHPNKFLAQLGRPLAGAPWWEWLFQSGTLVGVLLGWSGWVLGLLVVGSSAAFALAHRGRSPPEQKWLFVVGLILSAVVVFPLLLTDPYPHLSTGKFSFAAGVFANILTHMGYNALVLSGRLPKWMTRASMYGSTSSFPRQIDASIVAKSFLWGFQKDDTQVAELILGGASLALSSEILNREKVLDDLGFSLSEVMRNAWRVVNKSVVLPKGDISDAIVRTSEQVKITADMDPKNGDILLSIENPGNINPSIFTLPKLRELRDLIQHLARELGAQISEPAPAYLSSLKASDEGQLAELEDLAAAVRTLTDKISKMERGASLNHQDAFDLIYRANITSDVEAFRYRNFDWDNKPALKGSFVGGMGVGLPIVKGTLKKYGMSLEATTGQGTTQFTIRIPKSLISEMPPVSSGNKTSVLDSREVRELFEAIRAIRLSGQNQNQLPSLADRLSKLVPVELIRQHMHRLNNGSETSFQEYLMYPPLLQKVANLHEIYEMLVLMVERNVPLSQTLAIYKDGSDRDYFLYAHKEACRVEAMLTAQLAKEMDGIDLKPALVDFLRPAEFESTVLVPNNPRDVDLLNNFFSEGYVEADLASIDRVIDFYVRHNLVPNSIRPVYYSRNALGKVLYVKMRREFGQSSLAQAVGPKYFAILLMSLIDAINRTGGVWDENKGFGSGDIEKGLRETIGRINQQVGLMLDRGMDLGVNPGEQPTHASKLSIYFPAQVDAPEFFIQISLAMDSRQKEELKKFVGTIFKKSSSGGVSPLVLPSTLEAGQRLGLSNDQIRTEYAPVVEALDVLNPWRFWKAHEKLNDGGQWKRLRGIAQIWLAMVWASALPGAIVSLGIMVIRLVTQSQMPTWMYWAPPVITLVGSIGWGYVLLLLGQNKKLLESSDPLAVIRSPLFYPFRFAFKGNYTEHHWWNTEHPDAALVEPPVDPKLDSQSGSAHHQIELNKATEEQLEIVFKNIFPKDKPRKKLVDRIIEQRNSSPFISFDDLINRVAGIGRGVAQQLQSYLYIEGRKKTIIELMSDEAREKWLRDYFKYQKDIMDRLGASRGPVGRDFHPLINDLIKKINPEFEAPEIVFTRPDVPMMDSDVRQFANQVLDTVLIPLGFIVQESTFDPGHLVVGKIIHVKRIMTPAGRSIPIYRVKTMHGTFGAAQAKEAYIIQPDESFLETEQMVRGWKIQIRDGILPPPIESDLLMHVMTKMWPHLLKKENAGQLITDTDLEEEKAHSDTYAFVHARLGRSLAPITDSVEVAKNIVRPDNKWMSILDRMDSGPQKKQELALALIEVQAKAQAIEKSKYPVWAFLECLLPVSRTPNPNDPSYYHLAYSILFAELGESLLEKSGPELRSRWISYLRVEATDIDGLTRKLVKAAKQVHDQIFWSLEERKTMTTDRPNLILPSTLERGLALGLSDQKIRTEYAPVVEALDVLNPWRFWKAHEGLNDGGQWKRLRGIAQIWLAMMWTAALPGILFAWVILVGRLVVQYQVPTWMYWAPPLFTLVGSIGWGYVLYFLGYSQKLLDAKNPRDITRSPLFRPFRFAFKGNRIEHRFWNTEHPAAALVKGGKGKRPRDHAQLQHLATQVSDAQLLADAGDFEKAIEKLERILAMKGSMVSGYREVARRERNGQLKRAVLEAKTLLEEWREAFVAALQKQAENSAFHTEYFSAIVALQHVIKVEKIRLANVSNHILVHELDEDTIDLQKQYHDSRIKEAEMKIASWRPELLQHIKAGAVGDTAKLFHDVITNAEALGLDNRHTAVLTAYKKLYEKHINVTLERISAEYQVMSKDDLLVFIRKDLAPRVDGVLDLNLKDSAQAAEEENRLLAGMTLEIIYQEITKPASTKRPEDFDELVNLVITFTHADESKVKEHLGAMGIVGQRMFLEIHEGRWELRDGRLRPSPAYMAEAKAGLYKITYSTSRKWVRHSALSTKQDVLLSKLKEMVANGKIGNKQFDFKISPVDLGDDFIAYVRWFEGSKKGVIVLLDTIGNITRRGTLTQPVMEHLDRISQLTSDKTLPNEPIYIPVTPPGGSTRAYSLPVGPVLGLSTLLMSVLLAPVAPLLSLVLTVVGAFVLFPKAAKFISEESGRFRRSPVDVNTYANVIADAFVMAQNPNASADDVAANINALMGSEKALGVGRRKGALTSLSTRDRDEVLRLVEEKLQSKPGSPSHSIDKNNVGTVPALSNYDRTVPTTAFGDDEYHWKGLSWMQSRGVVTQIDGIEAHEPTVLIGNKNLALDVRVQASSDLDTAIALINKTKRSMGRGVLFVPVPADLEGELKARLIQVLGSWDNTIQFVVSQEGFYQDQKLNLDVFLPALKQKENADLANTLLAISGDYTVSDQVWSEYNGRLNLKMILLVELLNGVFRAMPMDHATLQKIDRFARLATTSA